MSTPALDRATEELRVDECDRLGVDKTCPPSYWPRIARAAVSAALHDPDDPDWLVRKMVKHLAHESEETRCERVCLHQEWDELGGGFRNELRAYAAAFTAAILGEAS